MRLQHPAIVSLLDFSFEDKPPWLATEYIGGRTLQTYLKENPRLSLKTVSEILKTLLDALAYAHDQKVIHRDLKPANAMIDVTSGVQVKILDFGLAIIDRFDHEGNETAEDAPVAGISHGRATSTSSRRLHPRRRSDWQRSRSQSVRRRAPTRRRGDDYWWWWQHPREVVVAVVGAACGHPHSVVPAAQEALNAKIDRVLERGRSEL